MIFNKDHIIKYLNGELPYYEQHELEKLMLEDPFLSDAIDGLQQIEDPEKLSEAINEIEGFIESNYGRKGVVVPVYRNPLAIAAVISLIIVTVAVVFLVPDFREQIQSFLITDKEKEPVESPLATGQEDLIKEEEQPGEELSISDTSYQDPDTAPVETLDESAEIEDISTIDDSLDLMETEPILFAEDETEEDNVPEESDLEFNQDNRDSLAGLISDTGVAGAGLAQELSPVDDEPVVRQERQAERQAEPLAEMARIATEVSEPIEELRSISGQVVSANDNQPLAGVNVFVRGTAKGAITGADGTYELQLEEGEEELQFSFIGYQPIEINVTQQDNYDVALQTDISQLSEVVTVGYGTTDEIRVEPDRFASPVVSRADYNRYLQNNLIYPEAASDNNISGRVIVEFTVSTEGSISDMEVINGLGFGCDEEAMRLIREGPEWRTAIRNGIPIQEKVRVGVLFKP